MARSMGGMDGVYPRRRAECKPPLENYSPKCGVLCIMVRDLKNSVSTTKWRRFKLIKHPGNGHSIGYQIKQQPVALTSIQSKGLVNFLLFLLYNVGSSNMPSFICMTTLRSLCIFLITLYAPTSYFIYPSYTHKNSSSFPDKMTHALPPI